MRDYLEIRKKLVRCLILKSVPCWNASRGPLGHSSETELRRGILIWIDPTVREVQDTQGNIFEVVSAHSSRDKTGLETYFAWVPANLYPSSFQQAKES